MGGRYQITQVYFNGQGALGSSGPAETEASSDRVVDSDSLRALLATLPLGFSFFSPGVAGVTPEAAAVLKSKAVPGVFGVLVEDPNEANAPDPRPNAEEPAAVGDARPLPVKGEMALKGFFPPWEESPPMRRDAENVRVGASGLSLWDMDRESLLVLERRVHRFSLLSIGDYVECKERKREELAKDCVEAW